MQERSFKPGDILTACDNELNVPTGYLGHSAIVVDPMHIVEAVILFPHVKMATIESFMEVHPKHAQYRPNSSLLGNHAAEYAMNYYRISSYNYARGINVPPFSFSPHYPLDDQWQSIYCSKLIWLSYHFGADYTFYNDFFLFTPEDLDTNLSKDPNFTLIYKHPEFMFLVDS